MYSTGKLKEIEFKGMFSVPDNTIVKPINFLMNCHVCGKSFCPVDIVLQSTRKCDYYNEIWSRLYIIKEINSDFICEHLKKSKFIWMYDNPDRNYGKVLEVNNG